MKKLLGILVLGLLLSGCTPDPENFIGMDSSWVKPLVILFIICAVIVLIFLSTMNHLEKKNHSFGFFAGLFFLAGPGLITAICYILMVFSGFLIISFFYTTPIFLNFSEKNINNKEFTNNSKKILAYTLNNGPSDKNEDINENEVLFDIFNLIFICCFSKRY